VSKTRRRGRVVDTAGRPVPDAFVSVVWGTAPVPEIALVTEADGSFLIGLPAGRFRLQANTADGRVGDADASGESTEEILIQLQD
jgi:hypothetical protein